MARPKVNSESQKELDKVEQQFQEFENQVADLTLDRMNLAPIQELEPQTKLSAREIKKSDAPYIKPMRSINSREPFNEKYRAEFNRAWEYVRCIVENNEIIGEAVECWTKKFPGESAHFWKVPTNKPIMIPRILAEQLSKCRYHRLKMEENTIVSEDSRASYVGQMVVDQTKQRIDCRPAIDSFISMGF